MAVTQSPFCNPVQFQLAFDADAESAAESNIGGGPITLHALVVVNPSGGGATDVYVKLYDATSITAGTTAPDFILLVKSGTTRTILFGLEGDRFNNGLTMRCVQEAGTAGTTDPGSTVTVGVIAAA